MVVYVNQFCTILITMVHIYFIYILYIKYIFFQCMEMSSLYFLTRYLLFFTFYMKPFESTSQQINLLLKMMLPAHD